MKAFLSQTIRLMLPYRCAVCGSVSDAEDRMSYISSRYREYFNEESRIHVCGKCLSSIRPYKPDDRWQLCLSEPLPDDIIASQVLFIAMPYVDIITRVIPAIKFALKKDLARLMGIILSEILRREKISADLVVPVPLSDARKDQRGFNQAEEMSVPVAGMLKLPMVTDCLIRNRHTGRQTETGNRYERMKNIEDAFEVPGSWDIEGLTVILVDDVATTGFTMHEAALALYKAGAAKVLCVALAGNRLIKNAEAF